MDEPIRFYFHIFGKYFLSKTNICPKMKKIYIIVFLFATTLAIFAGSVKAQFTISGEFKMRGEYRDGYGNLRDSSKTPYATLLGRARLTFDYNSEKILTRFSLNDAWVFGQNNYSSDTISKNTINIFEAYLKYYFTENFAVKIGRTQLVYDDERFLVPRTGACGERHMMLSSSNGKNQELIIREILALP